MCTMFSRYYFQGNMVFNQKTDTQDYSYSTICNDYKLQPTQMPISKLINTLWYIT